ncbi:hypothetical protein SAMN04488516_11525 [Desulfonauticus submarinus]|uniref:Uncharacterized protein n=1 Tax=Desulfonauticus submarinus TaxID=206665 RepID=A0A1H0FY16_9BACT|nr:hypothetical protein [Desulfonauticus submarinus]SDN99568.1 hypothetical protein SAMN04488516_11525 [Desulfonauticus submarinus]
MNLFQWLKRFWILELMVIFLLSMIFGLIRGLFCFFPGIGGMIAGSIEGWISGKVSKVSEINLINFGQRLKFLALAVGIYCIVSVYISGFFRSGPDATIGNWLLSILDGYKQEPFIGVSRYSAQVVEGGLKGPWWLFFIFLDGICFAFLFLISYGIAED